MRTWLARSGLALFIASLAACTAESGDERIIRTPHPTVTPEKIDLPTDEGDGVLAIDERGLGLPSTAPRAFVCRSGAFCDDFEGPPEQPLGSRWSSVARSGGGKMEIDSESASVGKGAVTLFTPDADSSVFLDHSKDGVAGSWSGLLGFALKVGAVPAAQVGGPELMMKTPDGPISVRVSLRPEGLVLEQLAPESCRERCRPSATLIAPVKEGSWYRVRIGFEVTGQSAPPYGRIEATVDGGPLLTRDLNVPLYEGAVSLRAGITQGDTRRAIVNLDDVTLLVR